MAQINVIKDIDGIEGLCIIEPKVHKDARGSFTETYNKREFAEFGLDADFVQDNRSVSTKGVLRGLHYQMMYPQTKIVRAESGIVYDVAVDLRKDSPTFGKWHGLILSGDNMRQFYIPKGFAHGFLVLSEKAVFCYKCDDYYHPEDENGIAWNDPELAVVWQGVKGEYSGSASADGYYLDNLPLIISEKDGKRKRFRELFPDR